MTQDIDDNNSVSTTSGGLTVVDLPEPTEPPAPVSNNQFLQAVFGQDINKAHVTVFHDDPNNIQTQDQRARAWAGGHWGNLLGLFTQGGNQYYTISIFNPAPDGRDRRRISLFKQCHVVVIDDVGMGLSAKVDPLDSRILTPSFALETSPDNCQYGYILATPETSASRVDNLLDGMVSAGIVEDLSDPGMKGVTRYVRLPEGTNNKQKYVDVLGAPFACKMTQWRPQVTYTLEQLAEPFGIDLDAEREDKQGITIDDESHPALVAYASQFGIKAKLDGSRYDVTCPHIEEHSDMDDSGTAIWTYPDGRLGFKCHHSHGHDLSGNTIMNMLFEHDPSLSERVALYGSGFSAQTPSGPTTIDHQTQQPEAPPDLTELCNRMSVHTTYAEIESVMRVIAQLPREGQRDPFMETIAEKTERRLAALRSDLKDIIRENRRALATQGMEPEWVHTNEDGRPLSTIENFYALLNFYGIRDRYNEMTKSLEIQIPNEDFHTDTAKNAQILRMESLMIQYGMNPKQTVGWCNYAAQYDTYHPFREYLDRAGVWDGLDRFRMLADTLIVPEDKKALRDTLLRRWLVSVCAAALRDTTLDSNDTDESAPAPRGVFTLQGEQYMGKTRWFRSITPKTMFKEGLQLGQDKDSVKQATNCLIVEIGEADTSTKQDAGRTKAFISRDYDELRVPWDKAESRWPRRTVFGGSVNPAKYLTDTTGNSRWWSVPVDDIDFFKLSMVDIKQLWLQAESLWLSGEPYLLTDAEMAELNNHNVASQIVTPFEDALLDLWCFDTMEGQEEPSNWFSLADITTKMKAYGIVVPKDTSITKEVLRRLTGKMYDRRRHWKMPVLRQSTTTG